MASPAKKINRKTGGRIRPLREAVFVGITVFLTAMAGISYLAVDARLAQKETVRTDLSCLARAAAGLVDGDLHQTLTDPSQMGGADYLRAVEPLVKFHSGVPEIAYLYTLVEIDGKFHFVLDSASAANRLGFNRKMEVSRLLDVYESYSPEEDKAEMEALREGEMYVSAKPFTDEFGTFLTALAPIKNSAGKTVGVVGVDLDVADYMHRLQRVLVSAILSSVFVIIASALVGLLVYRIRRRLKGQENEKLITEAEKVAIEEQEHRLVRALGQIVYHYDAARDQIVWRGECESILGWTPEEMPSTPEFLKQKVYAKDAEAMDEWEKALSGKVDSLLREYRCIHRDGHPVWVLDRAVLTRDAEGRLISADGVLLDISQRKQFESDLIAARDAAEAAGKAKSEFLAVMSHEIRTPMNGVIGCASLLLDTPISATQREYLETIRKCGDSLLRLISDILDFSKMESNKLTLEARAFSLHECIEEVLDLYGLTAAEKHIELVMLFTDRNLDWIYGDEMRIRQILINLIGNALKFTASGEIVVTVSRLPSLSEGEAVMLSVKDTGIGISEENQKDIFLPFNQADSSITRRFGGTGLGLAICGRLATLMGGTIAVHSKPGEGAEFVLLLPLREAKAEKQRPDVSVLQGKSAVVVDDRSSFCTMMRTELEAIGVRVIAAGDVHTIRTELESIGLPNIGLVDGGLPTKTIEEFVAFLRAKDGVHFPKLVKLVVPEVSGSKEPTNVVFDSFITKPVARDELARSLVGLYSPSPEPAIRDTENKFGNEPLAERHPLKILVVEDNPTNRQVIFHMLKRFGYIPQMVENGLLCIDILKTETFDMILMDVQMPEMDGYETTATLRKNGDNTWITALTADALAEDTLRCKAAGMNDYLSKPVRIASLREAIERCYLAKMKS